MPAFAETGKITELSKGSKAPFSGVLLTDDLATKLYLDAKFSPKECDIRVEREVGIKELQCKKDRDILSSKLVIQKEKYESIIGFKDNRIDFLEKRWHPQPWYEKGEFWLSVGVITGILITVTAGYALGQVSR